MRKNIHWGLGFLVVILGLGVHFAQAVAPGTPAAEAALSFDPFNPTASGSTPFSGELIRGSAKASAAIPSVLTPAATVINPGTIVVSVHDTEVQQSASSFTTAQFKVTLTKSSNLPITVNYATSDGTATHVLDYVTTSGTLTFNPGQTTLYVPVPIRPQNATDDETFYLNLSNASGATIGRGTGSCLVLGNNAPNLRVVGTTVPHGTSGTSIAYATVYLDHGGSKTVYVKISAFNDTAKRGIDYKAISEYLTFKPGQTSQKVPITIYGIPGAIPNRQFYAYIGGAVNAYVETGTAAIVLTGHPAGPSLVTPSAATLNGGEGRTTSGTVATFMSSNAAYTTANFTASINWGDGLTSSGTIATNGSAGHFLVKGSHIYHEQNAPSGPYAIKVKITATDGGTASVNSSGNIVDAPLDTPAGVTTTVSANTTFTNKLIGTFRDQDPTNADGYVYRGTIDWGDNTTSALGSAEFVSATPNVGSYWQVRGTHKYTTKKTYTVTINVFDTGATSAALKAGTTITSKITAN